MNQTDLIMQSYFQVNVRRGITGITLWLKMEQLASGQPGFLGVESVRDSSGAGITISYWESLDAIRNWKQHQSHKVAQEKGKKEWYQNYKVKICKVEREYS